MKSIMYHYIRNEDKLFPYYNILKKKEFNTYLIHSDTFASDMPQGDIRSINCFKNKGEFDEKILTNIIYKEIFFC